MAASGSQASSSKHTYSEAKDSSIISASDSDWLPSEAEEEGAADLVPLARGARLRGAVKR